MANYPLNIRPFDVPQTVTIELPVANKQDGLRMLPIIQIADLPRETLIELCSEFQSRLLTAYDQAQATRRREEPINYQDR